MLCPVFLFIRSLLWRVSGSSLHNLSKAMSIDAASHQGTLKRGRAFAEVIDLVEDPDNPRTVYRRIESGRKGEQKLREEREQTVEGRREAEVGGDSRWDIGSECYGVPFPSDANMFCLQRQNNFKVWYEFCNKSSALERNNYKVWENCFPDY